MRKVLLPILIIIIIFLFIDQFYYQTKHDEIITQIYDTTAKELHEQFQQEISKKHDRTAAITFLISQDQTIIEALIKDDNSLIDYTHLAKGIESFSDYEDLWIQIIDKNGYSFYRSWTNKEGDSLVNARADVKQMIKDPQPMEQVSTGKFDMTFKTMIPLYHEGRFIGMVELISHFTSIAKELKRKKIEPLFVVDESYTDKFIKPYTGLFIGNNYIANSNASEELMKKVESFGLGSFLELNDYMIFQDYLVTTDQIRNIKDGPMGYFILFKKLDSIDMTLLQDFKISYMEKITLFILVIILGILWLINRNYVKTLNEEVLSQTSKIKRQKENLSKLLNIYDQHVIFSKTDPKGFITHASEAFCKVCGYTKKELIGKNHNIIRHPDMPKDAFRYLWKELKKGNSVKLEVKNKSKDGGHYWVDAEFEPEYNKDGELLGYIAIRDDITANKDIDEIQKEIIFTMGSIGESRSKETGNHVKRVAKYSKTLALLYGLSDEEAEMLEQASPMHDIGKVAIPDSILNKPGQLSTHEKVIMQTHVTRGYDMLKSSNRILLKTAATIALEHHERWDGKGYPKGLKEEEINIFARITSIADVFDALGSDRCYKKAWDDEKIFAYFKDERGKHFDPKLVDLFFENLDSFLKIREEYKDSFV